MTSGLTIWAGVLGGGYADYAVALFADPDATLADLREAVTTLEVAGRIARRVLGSAHPTTAGLERVLETSRAVLRAREAPPPSSGGA